MADPSLQPPHGRADGGAHGAAPAGHRDHCPRCGAAFHCGRHDPTPCACGNVRLSAATLAALRTRYDTCLCGRCLQALANDEAPAGR